MCYQRYSPSCSPLDCYPKAWSVMVGVLRANSSIALTQEGIFRISGETSLVNQTCHDLNDGQWTLRTRDYHVVACALKRWLAELPSPLIPSSVHRAILKAMRADGADEHGLIPTLHQLLDGVPLHSYLVFMDLLGLLKETLDHRATNLMTENGLATLFSPLVLQSQKDLIAYMQNMEIERRWMELLLLHPPPMRQVDATPLLPPVMTHPLSPFHDPVALALVGDVLVTVANDQLVALNASTTDVRFCITLASSATSWATTTRHPLVFLGSQMSVHAIDVEQGKEVWRFRVPLSAGGPCRSLALMSRDALLVAVIGASIFGFDPQQGTRTLFGCNDALRLRAPTNAWKVKDDKAATPLVVPIEGFGWDGGSVEPSVALQAGVIFQKDYAPHYQQMFSNVPHIHYLGSVDQECFVVTIEAATISNALCPLAALITSKRGWLIAPLAFDDTQPPPSTPSFHVKHAILGRRSATDVTKLLSSSIPTSSDAHVAQRKGGAEVSRGARASGRKRSGSLSGADQPPDVPPVVAEATPIQSPETLLRALEEHFPGCTLTRIESSQCLLVDVMISRALLELEAVMRDVHRSVAIVSWNAEQTISQALSNPVTEEYETFLSLLGDRVRLKGWQKFAGGLDVEHDSHGEYSVFAEHNEFEIMWHVPAMLPISASDAQRLAHIASDHVGVVFWQGPGPFDASEMLLGEQSKVIIVVERVGSRYRVAVVGSKDVAPFEPHVPLGGTFKDDAEFRQWLLLKIINGQRAIFNAPHFQEERIKRRSLRLAQLVQQTRQHIPATALRLSAPFDTALLPVAGAIIKYRALSAVSAGAPTQLSFGKGDVIVLYHKTTRDVWNGGVGRQRGDFLAQHVALILEEGAVPEATKKSGSMIQRKRVPRARSESIPCEILMPGTPAQPLQPAVTAPDASPSGVTRKVLMEALMEEPPILIPDARWMKWTSISYTYDWSRLNVVHGYHSGMPQPDGPKEVLAAFVEPLGRVPFYQQTFLQRPHTLFVGASKTGEHFVIATELACPENRGVPILALLITKAATARAVINMERASLPGAITHLPSLLDSLFPGCSVRPVESGSAHDLLSERLVEFENMHLDFNRRLGILYWKSGQTENEAFANPMSDTLDTFLRLLGERVRLKGWRKFRGGLNVTNDETGEYSVYAEFHGFAFMSHVSALLPHNPNDAQQLDRKRHIGNDLVVVIFWEGEGSFDPSKLVTQMCHVFIVVEPVGMRYRVSTVCKSGVPPFPPHLPEPPLFSADESFREWLFMKIINGERAALQTKAFLSKTSTARATLLDKMTAESLAVPQRTPGMSLCAPWKLARFVVQEPASKYKAVQAFESPSPFHLHLRKGDEVVVFCKVSEEWWNGAAGNRRGDFPAVCVAEKSKGSRVGSRKSSTQQHESAKKQRPTSVLLSPTCEVAVFVLGASNLVLLHKENDCVEARFHVATPTGMILPGSEWKTQKLSVSPSPQWNEVHNFELVDPLWETLHVGVYAGDTLVGSTTLNCERIVEAGASGSTLELPLQSDQDEIPNGTVALKVLRAVVLRQEAPPTTTSSESPAASPVVARKRLVRNRSVSHVEAKK